MIRLEWIRLDWIGLDWKPQKCWRLLFAHVLIYTWPTIKGSQPYALTPLMRKVRWNQTKKLKIVERINNREKIIKNNNKNNNNNK